MESVDEKVAVPTEAVSGIGRATALSLARRGATIILSDLEQSRANLVAAEIQAPGGRLLVLTDPVAASMVHHRGLHREAFLASLIEWLGSPK